MQLQRTITVQLQLRATLREHAGGDEVHAVLTAAAPYLNGTRQASVSIELPVSDTLRAELIRLREEAAPQLIDRALVAAGTAAQVAYARGEVEVQ